MATLDIFNNDAFSVSQLSQTITDVPNVPTKLGDKGLFREYGINTVSMMIERQGSSLKLLPTAPRGGVREPAGQQGPRKLIPLHAVHIPASWSVLADEVQGIRAFGQETEVMQASDLVAQKLATVRASMDLTMEYQRVGALKGLVLDADGSTLLDVYAAFGMTQNVMAAGLASRTAGDPRAFCVNLKRAMQAKLGGRTMGSVRVICSASWFDNLTQNAAMDKAWALWNNGAYLRTDANDAPDFQFAGVNFEVYLGGTSSGDFIEDGDAYAYPEGVPGMFQTAYAPADYMETVNTIGLPFYAKQEPMPFNKGIAGEAQSNPLTFNSLPEAVFKITA